MFVKHMFANKSIIKLSTNVCNQCLRRFVWTKREITPKRNNNSAKNQFLYIEDTKTAQLVIKHLNSGLLSNDVVIFESSPGNGLLTEQLLKSGFRSVRVFEDNPNFLNKMKKLQKQYSNRLQIIEKQIFNYKKFLENGWKTYENDLEEWFKDIDVQDWTSLPNIAFVAILSPKETYFIRYLIKRLISKELFFAYGRTQLLVVVSELEYKHMIAKSATDYNLYRSVSVLYQTLFDIETLETLDYKEFGVYPNDKIKPKEIKGIAKLIRLSPKLYLDEMDVQFLNDFYYFVSQTFMKRKNFVIPFLENWFPNCGPDLIQKGIPVFKYFGDLKPEEVLDLFKHIQKRSDYNRSLYKTFVNDSNESLDLIESPDVKEGEVIDEDIEKTEEL